MIEWVATDIQDSSMLKNGVLTQKHAILIKTSKLQIKEQLLHAPKIEMVDLISIKKYIERSFPQDFSDLNLRIL